MEGMSHDSTPCTDCRSFRSSICSSPPVFPGIETFFPVSNHRSSGCPERNPSGFLARQVYYLYASPLDQPPIDVRSEVETIHEAFAEAWKITKGFESTFKHMGGFLKWWYPQIIHFNRVFHYKPSILGYPYFWKHPHPY